MSKAQWEVFRDRSGRLYVAGDATGPIAWINEDDVSQDSDENASLIAAAPDLYAALVEIVEDITHEDHEPGDWSVQIVVRNARAAIAKARGGA